MDAQKVVAGLSERYPGKKIITLPQDHPSEILCEIDPTEDHPEFSAVISVIDKSVPHYHKKMTEVYEILQGELTVYIDGRAYELKEGERIEIQPGAIHYATGQETWIQCNARPGWTAQDHILIENLK